MINRIKKVSMHQQSWERIWWKANRKCADNNKKWFKHTSKRSKPTVLQEETNCMTFCQEEMNCMAFGSNIWQAFISAEWPSANSKNEEWMTSGRTSLVEKSKEKETSSYTYRPILYLPFIWLTKIMQILHTFILK